MTTQQRLLIPGLGGFYATVGDIAYTFLRIVVGAMFLMHVWSKFNMGAGAVAASMTKNGLEPGLTWAYITMALEVLGGISLVIGLFTRLFGAALAIEMLVALIVVHLPKGYAAGTGGYEYVLLIGAACFLISLRGGGPYSVDRAIGKEL